MSAPSISGHDFCLDNGEVVEEYRTYLRCIAEQVLCPRLRSKAGASDYVQETLMQAHCERHTFNGNTREEWFGWLREILLNKMRGFYRSSFTLKRQADREVSFAFAHNVPAPEEPPGDLVSRAEERQRLALAIRRLSVDHQQVIYLRTDQKLTFREIGERMDRTPDAARMLFNHAVENLRTTLQN